MTATAEIRWFVSGPLPEATAAWFGALAPQTSDARTDRYLVPRSAAVGEKWREGRAERKTRTDIGGALGLPTADGRLEHWCKAQISSLPDAPSLEVAKRRQSVRALAPGGLCTLELGTARVGGATWWTVCLEAVGPTAAGREHALRVSALRWLARPGAPVLHAEAARGYPAWLAERASATAGRP